MALWVPLETEPFPLAACNPLAITPSCCRFASITYDGSIQELLHTAEKLNKILNSYNQAAIGGERRSFSFLDFFLLFWFP